MKIEQGFEIILACHNNIVANIKKKAQLQYATNTAATIALKLKKLGIPDLYSVAILFFGKPAYDQILAAYQSKTLNCNLYDLNLETEVQLRSYFQKELFLANKSWFYADSKYWQPKIAKMSLLDMIVFFLVPSDTLWEIKKESFNPPKAEKRLAPKALPLDKKENLRLSNIAFQLTDLKRLHALVKDNPDHAEFLSGFAEQPYALLERLGVDRSVAEKVFTSDEILTPNFIEAFRQTQSRKFWE